MWIWYTYIPVNTAVYSWNAHVLVHIYSFVYTRVTYIQTHTANKTGRTQTVVTIESMYKYVQLCTGTISNNIDDIIVSGFNRFKCTKISSHSQTNIDWEGKKIIRDNEMKVS